VIATCNRLTPRLFPTLASRAQRLHSLRHIFTVVCARVCDALRSRRFFGARRVGRGRRANVSLPNGYAGRMQTLVEWEASLNELQLGQQATALREWLSQTDERIKERLVPLLTPSADELAQEAAVAAAEAEEEAREAAAAAAEAATAEPSEEEEGEEESDDDEGEEEERQEAKSKLREEAPEGEQQQHAASSGLSDGGAAAPAA